MVRVIQGAIRRKHGMKLDKYVSQGEETLYQWRLRWKMIISHVSSISENVAYIIGQQKEVDVTSIIIHFGK